VSCQVCLCPDKVPAKVWQSTCARFAFTFRFRKACRRVVDAFNKVCGPGWVWHTHKDRHEECKSKRIKRHKKCTAGHGKCWAQHRQRLNTLSCDDINAAALEQETTSSLLPTSRCTCTPAQSDRRYAAVVTAVPQSAHSHLKHNRITQTKECACEGCLYLGGGQECFCLGTTSQPCLSNTIERPTATQHPQSGPFIVSTTWCTEVSPLRLTD
jgi:hypothetical protein